MATYLDFEQKIKQIQEEIISAEVRHDEHAAEILKKDLEKEVQKTYSNLTPFQELQLARHQDRPYALDYVNLLMSDHYEIHGDRHFADDRLPRIRAHLRPFAPICECPDSHTGSSVCRTVTITEKGSPRTASAR